MIDGFKPTSSKVTESQRPMGEISTGELLCIPFLDTDTRRDTQFADAELRLRGYPDWLISLLRIICAGGLWQQAVIWEDFHLDLADVAIGYGVPLTLMGVILAVLANVGHTTIALAGLAIAGLGVVLIIFALLGWKRNRVRFERMFSKAKEKKD